LPIRSVLSLLDPLATIAYASSPLTTAPPGCWERTMMQDNHWV